jgi:hypothetical protein
MSLIVVISICYVSLPLTFEERCISVTFHMQIEDDIQIKITVCRGAVIFINNPVKTSNQRPGVPIKTSRMSTLHLHNNASVKTEPSTALITATPFDTTHSRHRHSPISFTLSKPTSHRFDLDPILPSLSRKSKWAVPSASHPSHGPSKSNPLGLIMLIIPWDRGKIQNRSLCNTQGCSLPSY